MFLEGILSNSVAVLNLLCNSQYWKCSEILWILRQGSGCSLENFQFLLKMRRSFIGYLCREIICIKSGNFKVLWWRYGQIKYFQQKFADKSSVNSLLGLTEKIKKKRVIRLSRLPILGGRQVVKPRKSLKFCSRLSLHLFFIFILFPFLSVNLFFL